MTAPSLHADDAAPAFDEALLLPLVRRFYARVRGDTLLGPLFNDVVADWPEHLTRLETFWSSVMFTSGRYKGNPIVLHLKHSERIDYAMFDRWLEIWQRTTDEMLPRAAAMAMQSKAKRIADRLMLALQLKPSLEN